MIIGYVLITLFAGATIITHIVLNVGLLRSRMREKRLLSQPQLQQLQVSIVIPAHNEEKDLPYLLETLEAQSDPGFELVLINDRSTDATLQIMQEYREKHPSHVTVVTLSENPQPLNPKQYALEKGIETTDGDIILFTDADCRVPPRWVELYKKAFAESETGIVFGPVYTLSGKTFLKKYQMFDHVFRYYYTAASAGLSLPSGGFGNNLAVRKEALEAIGGYGSLDYSVTEDAELITTIGNTGRFSIRALTSPAVAVTPCPQNSWKALTAQELRWSSGAFFSSHPETKWGYGVIMLYLAGGVFALPFIPLFPPLAWISCATFMSMFSIAFTGGILSRRPFSHYWLTVIPNILFSGLLYLYVDALALMKVSITWKGQTLTNP